MPCYASKSLKEDRNNNEDPNPMKSKHGSPTKQGMNIDKPVVMSEKMLDEIQNRTLQMSNDAHAHAKANKSRSSRSGRESEGRRMHLIRPRAGGPRLQSRWGAPRIVEPRGAP